MAETNSGVFRRSPSNVQIQKQCTIATSQSWIDNKVPPRFWNVHKNQLEYMNWLSSKLNIQSIDDWYNVTYKVNHQNFIRFLLINKFLKDFRNNNGSSLLEHYGYSHIKAIMSLYPDYHWLPWKFSSLPKGFWEDQENVKNYIKWLEKELNIKNMEDWYKITYKVSMVTMENRKKLIKIIENCKSLR